MADLLRAAGGRAPRGAISLSAPAASAIEARLRAAVAAGDVALIVFLVLGYPDRETSVGALEVLRRAGVAVFELALPAARGWSPLASAPIVEAHRRACAAGVTPGEAAGIGARHRPNLYILYRGTWDELGPASLGLLGDRCDAVLPEWRGGSADECLRLARRAGLNGVEAVSPATSPQRLAAGVKRSQGMVYLTVAEATGGRLFDRDIVAAALGRIKRCRDIPVCCGFGVRTPQDVADLGRLPGCDGVIVGTAALQALDAGLPAFERYITTLAAAARGLKRPSAG